MSEYVIGKTKLISNSRSRGPCVNVHDKIDRHGYKDALPVIKSKAININVAATRQKYVAFVTISESTQFFVMTYSLKMSLDP